MISVRLTHFLAKRLRARRLGVSLGRSANFRLPASIVLGRKRYALWLPDETGVKVAFMELLLADSYELGQVPGMVETVLDIGANVGLFCLAARNAFPEATIHAYEPNPQIEPYLKVQAATAACKYFMEAVGPEDGRVVLSLGDDSVMTRSQVDEAGDVPAIAFRKTIERMGGRIDLLKLDCEGAEWGLFEDRESWNGVRNLSMEYHLWPDHAHEKVREVVSSLGFTIRKQVPASDFGLLYAHKSKSV